MSEKAFPKLVQTHVRIVLDASSGEGFDCPMLPVSAVWRLRKLRDRAAEVKTWKEFDRLHKEMVKLAKSVIPAQYAEGLERFEMDKLTELLGYLVYGDAKDDDQPIEAHPTQKKSWIRRLLRK